MLRGPSLRVQKNSQLFIESSKPLAPSRFFLQHHSLSVLQFHVLDQSNLDHISSFSFHLSIGGHLSNRSSTIPLLASALDLPKHFQI
mmetsp:Transcript_25824/g.85087  ORF Transcript_25824/g.85087 Transcript_25824/m.85087 type:complete len:87 (-) Transcript_25824:150-410(-)